MSNDKYKLVNWQEGMGLNCHHLQQTENYFIERLGDNLSTRLTGYNYGLLPSADRKNSSSEFDISQKITGKVEIRLRSCNAITASGYRIAYNPNHLEYLQYTHSFDNEGKEQEKEITSWDVIVTINPYKRIPTGTPDHEENPPRHPDVTEEYKLSVLPQGYTNYEQLGGHYLVIGRIRKNGSSYQVNTDYIPPCTSMCSHPDLLKYYEFFGRCLGDIEKASQTIITKIRNRSQNSVLAFHIAAMCENMMRYISQIYFCYRNMGRDALPIDIVNYFSTLAYTCFISLNMISKTDKEELLKYFYEWSDVTPGSFEELLSDTLSIVYDHNSIRTTMLQIEMFIRVMTDLWYKLSGLEYIGQHKENIVISERSYGQEAKKNTGGWTILD